MLPSKLGALCGLLATLPKVAFGQENGTEWPLHDNGLNKVVQWLVTSGRRWKHDTSKAITLTFLQGSLQLPHQWRETLHVLRRGMIHILLK